MVGPVVFAFLLGLVPGSFVTAVAHRVPRGMPLLAARSECPACGARIAARDNVPVAGWLLLRGRARCCGASISPRYPLTELALGLLFALTVLVHWDDPVAEVAIDLVFLTMLAAVTLTDLEQRIIPNRVLLAGAIALPRDRGPHRSRQPPRARDRRCRRRRHLLPRRPRLPEGHGPRRRQACRDDGPLPRPRRRPGDPRRAPGRQSRRPRPDRPPRLPGPQDGDPLRPLPGPGRRGRACSPATSWSTSTSAESLSPAFGWRNGAICVPPVVPPLIISKGQRPISPLRSRRH